MTGVAPEVVQEHFLNKPTGVEADQEDDAAEIAHPWQPDQIRVSTKNFSIRNILDMIAEESLELAPDFQRNAVWKDRQKSRLIESLLLQIPLPAFYFAEDTDGLLRVVDGLQRLSTVRDFVRNDSFALRDLEYLSDVTGRSFRDLPAQWQRRINNTQIVVHVIDPQTPRGVKYDIFKRINTGGTPLNAQEIRHCMSKPRSRAFLKKCAQLDEFRSATDMIGDHIRMEDRELALRFCAFRLRDVERYAEVRAMDIFLEEANELLDDSRALPDHLLDGLFADFRRAMYNCRLVFGDHAFRKWPLGHEGRNPINRPLFETWAVVLADSAADDLSARRDAIVHAARRAMAGDLAYVDAISNATGNLRKVRLRFDVARRASQAGK
jgi:Protein of unknown function DUF262